MKIAIAEFVQETGSFSSITTSLDEFSNYGIYRGQELLEQSPGVGPLGGLLEVAGQESDAITSEFIPTVRAWAGAGGVILSDTFKLLSDEIIAGIAAAENVAAVFLSLHGAAAAQGEDDVEGFIIDQVRQLVGTDIPIAVSLDHHANITRRMVAAADVLVGHETQPHDPLSTGRKTAKILYSHLKGETTPTIAWRKIPMITPQDQFLTSSGPMQEWFDKARDYEQDDRVLDVSPYPMQPWLDVDESGWSVVVHTDNDVELAQQIADEMADWAWASRERFRVSERVQVDEAVQIAADSPEGLIILSDTGDSVYGGAPGNSVHILSAMLNNEAALQHERLFLVPIIDTQALQQALDLGAGNEIEVSVGSHTGEVTGVVSFRGSVVSTSLAYTADIGERGSCEIGRSALLQNGALRIVLLEQRTFAINHPVLYQHHQIDMANAQAVVVKTASNFQFFAEWRKQMVRVDSPGATQSDLTALPWLKLTHPIWPFDESLNWSAKSGPIS